MERSPAPALSETIHLGVGLNWKKAINGKLVTLRRLESLVSPGGLILFGAWALQREEIVKDAALPYASYACYATLAAAALLSWYHAYARVLCVALVTGLAVWSAEQSLPSTSVAMPAFAFLVPLDFALFAILKERGIATLDGIAKISLIGAQVLGVYLLGENSAVTVKHFLRWGEGSQHWTWMSSPVLISFSATGMLLLFLVLRRQTNVEAGLLCAMAGVFSGLNHPGNALALYLYCGGSGLILMFSVLEHGYDIAYRDELTGLPGRRAFNEVLRQLRRQYTIAMCDVDHFKTFNDTYGHDAGDRALKVVASTLLQVEGGGRAFRYGGEEFALIFKGSSAVQVERAVDAVRESIARMGHVLHAAHRPMAKSEKGTSETNPVSITISVGLADHSASRTTPENVLEAADAALYLAKESGRNRVRLA